MTDVKTLLDRQAEWQKKRARLSWAEKIRMAEDVRESIQALKKRKRR